MIDNNSMYSGNTSSPEYEQYNNEEVQLTDQDVVSQLLDENPSNLSTQPTDTSGLSEENKALKDELETLKREFSSFKETAQALQNESLMQEVTQMRQLVANAQRAERERAVMPIMETLKEMGVPLKDVTTVFNEVKQQFGVDLRVNPNVDLVRYYVEKSNWLNPANNYATPKGGYYQPTQAYNNHYAPAQSYDESAYQQKLEAKRQQLIAEAKQRYSK